MLKTRGDRSKYSKLAAFLSNNLLSEEKEMDLNYSNKHIYVAAIFSCFNQLVKYKKRGTEYSTTEEEFYERVSYLLLNVEGLDEYIIEEYIEYDNIPDWYINSKPYMRDLIIDSTLD